ncbi:SCO0607 family lipoprotein [Streptomyces sp. NPDC048111]|uniref:SCO0607 family lipoprotein n=1 Tax=Streptomyces sp. NPDC048111 TaxID=3365500 RepID=UPI00371E01F4
MRQPHHPEPASHTSSGPRGRGRPAALLLGSAAVLLALAGCSTQDAICGGGQYPVLNVGSAGKACVDDDQEPPQGYVRYPKGKVPEHVGDKWDTYWQTHTLDKSGRTVGITGS